MGFRSRPETDLERELRAQRPRPREEFLQALGRELPAPKPSRMRVRFALVAAVTLVLAAALGVGGAVGYAKHSVTSFGDSVYHVVHAESSPGDDYGHDAYQWEEPPGFRMPVCYGGKISLVPVIEYFFDLYGGRGYHTAKYCLSHPG